MKYAFALIAAILITACSKEQMVGAVRTTLKNSCEANAEHCTCNDCDLPHVRR
jgi:hypothetical protein